VSREYREETKTWHWWSGDSIVQRWHNIDNNATDSPVHIGCLNDCLCLTSLLQPTSSSIFSFNLQHKSVFRSINCTGRFQLPLIAWIMIMTQQHFTSVTPSTEGDASSPPEIKQRRLFRSTGAVMARRFSMIKLHLTTSTLYLQKTSRVYSLTAQTNCSHFILDIWLKLLVMFNREFACKWLLLYLLNIKVKLANCVVLMLHTSS